MCDCVCVCLLQYMGNVEPWCKACGEGDLPSELQDLEDTIHHHTGLYEHITTAYSEVLWGLQSLNILGTSRSLALFVL